MSRYRGPCFKKIQQLGALPELTSKRHKLKAILETNYNIRVSIRVCNSCKSNVEFSVYTINFFLYIYLQFFDSSRPTFTF